MVAAEKSEGRRMSIKVSEATRRKIRDYAVNEPSYTVAFAAWELGMSRTPIGVVNQELLDRGIVREIEPRSGPNAAVYAYVPPRSQAIQVERARHFPELDESRLVGLDAPERGAAVAHTGGAVGPSGRPGRDRKKQEAGFKVKRRT